VYALGVILFRMLTGRLPFESPSAVDLLRRRVHEAPPPVSALRPDAPADLAAVADAALTRDPAARPPDGRAVLDLLQGTAAPTLVATGAAETRVMEPVPASGGPKRRVLLAALIV